MMVPIQRQFLLPYFVGVALLLTYIHMSAANLNTVQRHVATAVA